MTITHDERAKTMKTITVVLLLAMAAYAAGPKNFWRVTKLNDHDVAVSCPGGQIPDLTPAQGRIETNYVIVTCSQ